MQTIVNNTNTYYLDEGQGPLVVLLHGWGCEGETYRSIVQLLKGTYRVVIPDIPGFGKSDEPPFGWSNKDYADWAEAFIGSFGEKKLTLLGHSFGCRILSELVVRDSLPFEVDRMVFIGGAGVLSRELPRYLRGFRWFCVRDWLASTRIGRTLFPKGKERVRLTADGDYAELSKGMRRCYLNTVKTDCTPFYEKFPMPTLLVYGENDRETPVEDGRKMERLIPDAGLVVVPNAGHYCFLEQPYYFNEVMKSFLEL